MRQRQRQRRRERGTLEVMMNREGRRPCPAVKKPSCNNGSDSGLRTVLQFGPGFAIDVNYEEKEPFPFLGKSSVALKSRSDADA